VLVTDQGAYRNKLAKIIIATDGVATVSCVVRVVMHGIVATIAIFFLYVK